KRWQTAKISSSWTAGYDDAAAAAAAAEPYQTALGITGDVLVADSAMALPDAVDGIVVIGGNQALIDTAALAGIADAWRAGTPLLMDGAAAATAGAFYAAVAPTPYDSDDDLLIEEYTQGAFLQGKVEIKDGLGLVNAIVEPRVMDDNRWGRVLAVAYNHPDLLAVALADDTALELTAEGVTVHGNNGVFVFDLRNATLELGTNEGFVIANALLDVFAAGETLAAAPIESK
ncbi:cyanophycinase, partial [bacterium]|nr:cyanophycinase [bacterium]